MFFSTSKITKNKVKFSEIAEWWLESYAEKNLKERSIERYRLYTKRTYEALGDMPIKKIRPIHIQLFIDSLGEDGVNSRTGGGLSHKTIRGYLGFISDIMKYAWRLELINANPCERVIAPKLKKKEPVIYTEEETSKFLFYLQEAPTKYRAFFQLAIFAGLRRGELLGLEWTDVDFENCVITVRRNSQYTKRKGTYWDEPKSLAGHRVLKLPQDVFTPLKCLRREQISDCKKMGIGWSENMRLFTGKGGGPTHPNTPYNWLKRFCHNKKIPFYGVHQYRHLNASLLICTGADPTTVSHTLGHSQVSTTLNIYSHAFACAQAKASEAVGAALMQKISAQPPASDY